MVIYDFFQSGPEKDIHFNDELSLGTKKFLPDAP